MTNNNHNLSHKTGLSPGSLVFVGKKKSKNAKISILNYDEKKVIEKNLKNVEEYLNNKKSKNNWLNIDGLHNVEIIEKIGKYYNIHSLVLEDILNTNQRPKIEIYEDYIYVVLKMMSYDDNSSDIISEQVSLILGKDFVISFQEKEGDIFNPIRDRIRAGKGKIRKMNSDYLAYSILDIVVDYYFIILEKIGEKIESLEEDLIKNPKPSILKKLYTQKRELLFLRKSIWPLREAVSKLEKSESNLISKKIHPYLMDLYDHTIRVIDTIETNRDLLSGMMDLYLSGLSNKTNEVMKVLTIIATIFIPLTFIAGIYGMNFRNMPELSWKWGYFIALGLMATVASIMLFYFRKKKWI